MLLMILLLMFVPVDSQPKNCTYIMTVPKVTRPGTDIDICITVWKRGSGNVNIAAALRSNNGKTISGISKTYSGTSGKLHILKLKVPSDTPSGYNYNLDTICTGWIVFSKTIGNIQVDSKNASMFIQTDRPIYKPGDLVQFRAFGMKPSLDVIKAPIDVIIFDPLKNRVKQYLKLQEEYGVVSGFLQLSPETHHGRWTIEMNQLGQTQKEYIEVKEYVLPKFDVQVSVPGFSFVQDDFVTVRVSAVYTFGKPVEGYALINVTRADRSDSIFVKFEKIHGKVDIKIPMWFLYPSFGTSYSLFVKVNETVTGKEANDTTIFQLYTSKTKVVFSQSMPSTFKPGLKYTIMIRIEKSDGSSIESPLGTAKIIITYKYSVKVKESITTKTKLFFTKAVAVDKSGVVIQQVSFPKHAESGTVYVVYKGRYLSSKYISKATSPSNNYIQVRKRRGRSSVQPGRKLQLTVQVTEKIRSCYYKIFSKGSIVQQGIFAMNRLSRKQTIRVTHKMTPSFRILVYYVRRYGEIVADAVIFSVKDIFRNKVTMEFDKKTVEPGQAVNLKVKADPGSLVNILAVDKSVLLLGNANDITANNVLTKLQGFTSTPVPLLREWDSIGSVVDSGVDSKTVFTNSGVFIATDCLLIGHKEFEQSVQYYVSPMVPPAAFGPGSGNGDGNGGPSDGTQAVLAQKDVSKSLASPSRKRVRFLETWLWLNTTTNRNGVASLKSLVPDTITQWIATSFVVNPQSGLGVAAESAKIITYQRFFMRFELPYSAIRGETLILQITVFNYRNEDLKVHVNLNKNVNLTFVDVKGNIVVPKATAWTKILFVPKDTVKSVYFPIIPTKIGSTLLDASVRSTAAADAVQRPLLVKPEGIRENYNIPVVIDLRRKRKFSAKVRITFPDFVIPDSQFIKISVIGDLIGTTLAGVEDLLRMSYGCGEQNLVRFVPNVFISVYLKSTNRLTNDIKDKVDRYLSAGYQRQLSYAHVDGSFSAFGKSDRYGSTWLTAFVVKSFAQAALLTYIDPNVMRKAVRFLINNQIKETGEYKEKGVVYQKSMQGGSASSAASLTSYVVIALHEALTRKQIPDDAIKTTQESIKDAVSFIIRILENRTLIAKNNQFELVFATYALTLVDARISRTLLRQIERYSSRKDGTKFWKLTDDAANMIQPYVRWTPPKTKVRALDIEMTSYVLLIYNIRKDITNGVQVVKWLNKQKNPFGGFISTQDTVIAIQAITGFAEKTFVEQFNAVLTVKGDSWTGHTFTVDNTNSLVLHSVDAPRSIQQISIDCAGSGFLMSEVAVFFNVPEELRKPAFDLNTTVLNDSVLGFRLKLCFSWLRGGNSTMGYMEIALPTGMEADMESMNTTRTYGLYKKREASSDHLNLYFDWITTKEMCVEINIDRVNLVANQKPVPARLSEYYEQSNEVIRMYESKVLSQASAEDVCGLDRCR
ncbi:CD109 antigen-like [Mytilus galloprovincialis]|uniref:CD109 antigen-like n=1 Tax=Mytilus galloprovincialis TaxID=29158 RepID=UPI003F7BD4ED